MIEATRDYLKQIGGALAADNATEHTYRPYLKTLLESLEKGISAVNEPKRVACGAPDFIVTKGQIPLGYIEVKDIGKSLFHRLRGEHRVTVVAPVDGAPGTPSRWPTRCG